MLGMNFVFVLEMSVSLMARSNIIALLKICSPHGSKTKNYEFWEFWEIIHKSESCFSSEPYLATEVV